MASPPKTLREVLVERAGKARALDPDDVMDVIQDHLRHWPEAIEELRPGWHLVKKPLERGEQIRRMTKASIERRVEQARARHARVIPILEHARRQKPAISLRELARLLDKAGIKPQRSEFWSAASVRAVMISTGMIDEPTST